MFIQKRKLVLQKHNLSSEKYLGQSLESAATTAGMKGVSSAPLDTRCAGILLLYLLHTVL